MENRAVLYTPAYEIRNAPLPFLSFVAELKGREVMTLWTRKLSKIDIPRTFSLAAMQESLITYYNGTWDIFTCEPCMYQVFVFICESHM